jgi:hypoxanthine phosphoribosyltransferase
MANLHMHISAAEIERMNDALGARISADYAKVLKKDEELIVIVTLKGALFFAADLMRKITVPCLIDFVRLSSYGAGTQSSGSVHMRKNLEDAITGRHVLVLDEIVDSGRTLSFLVERLQSDQPASVKLCALLSKPSRREVPVDVEYLGQEVEDKFLVGYGLDHGERYRNLKEIYSVDGV